MSGYYGSNMPPGQYSGNASRDYSTSAAAFNYSADRSGLMSDNYSNYPYTPTYGNNPQSSAPVPVPISPWSRNNSSYGNTPREQNYNITYPLPDYAKDYIKREPYSYNPTHSASSDIHSRPSRAANSDIPSLLSQDFSSFKGRRDLDPDLDKFVRSLSKDQNSFGQKKSGGFQRPRYRGSRGGVNKGKYPKPNAGNKYGSNKNKQNRGPRDKGRWDKPRFQDKDVRRKDEPPPFLLGYDTDSSQKNDGDQVASSKRKWSESHAGEDGATRHVDEDLTVTIPGSPDKKKMYLGSSAGEGGSNKFYCTACKITILKNKNFQEHLRGKRHRQMVEEQAESRTAKAATKSPAEEESAEQMGMLTDKDVTYDASITLMPLDDPDRIRFYCTVCRLCLLTNENVICHEATIGHRRQVEDLEKLEQTVTETQELCKLCAVVFEKSEKEAHVSSTKHHANMHWRLANCDVCAMKFNNPKNLERHFQQRKHGRMLDNLKKVGLDVHTLVQYYEELNQQQETRRRSFCLMCTCTCGTPENLELHNIYAADAHKRKTAKVEKIDPGHFYCFCCETPVDEANRRHHGKSANHKHKKDRKKRFHCEDCHDEFNNETKLMFHFSSPRHNRNVFRRLKYKSWVEKKCLEGYNRTVIEAGKEVIAELSGTEPPSEVLPSSAGLDILKTVIPVAGDYCSACKKFYMFGSDTSEMCEHVAQFKGVSPKTTSDVKIKNEPMEDHVPEESDEQEAYEGERNEPLRIKNEPTEDHVLEESDEQEAHEGERNEPLVGEETISDEEKAFSEEGEMSPSVEDQVKTNEKKKTTPSKDEDSSIEKTTEDAEASVNIDETAASEESATVDEDESTYEQAQQDTNRIDAAKTEEPPAPAGETNEPELVRVSVINENVTQVENTPASTDKPTTQLSSDGEEPQTEAVLNDVNEEN